MNIKLKQESKRNNNQYELKMGEIKGHLSSEKRYEQSKAPDLITSLWPPCLKDNRWVYDQQGRDMSSKSSWIKFQLKGEIYMAIDHQRRDMSNKSSWFNYQLMATLSKEQSIGYTISREEI